MLSQLSMTVKGVVLLVGAVYFFAALLRKEDADWIKGSPLYIIVGLFLSGMWIHFVWLQYLAIFLAIPLLSKSRADAAALYAVTYVSTPSLYYKLAFGSFYVMPFTKGIFCALGLAVALLIKPKSAAPVKRHFDIPILVLLVLEIARARDPVYTEMLRQLLPVLILAILPYFLLSRSLNSPEEVRRFLIAIALTGFVMAIVASVEARTHWLVYKQVQTNLGISAQINAFGKMRGGVLRAPGSFPESTSLGAYLALVGVALVGLRTSFKSKRTFYMALGVLCVGLFAPNSRGAFVAIIVGWAAYDLYRRRYGRLLGKLGVGAGLYIVLLAAAQFSPYFAAMIGKGGTGTEASTDYRVQLLHRGLEEISKHPMIGTTMKTALANLEDLRQGEGIVDLVNGYINYGLVLGYAGIIGLLLVFLTLCAAMLLARKQLSVNAMVGDLAGIAFAVSSFTIVNSFYGGFGGENSTPFYEIAAVGSALWGLRRVVVHSQSGQLVSGTPAISPIRALILADRAAPTRQKIARSAGP